MTSGLPALERGEVPPRLLERIDNSIVERGIEDSRYGLINKLLNTIFWERKWMVDPQVLEYNSALADSYGMTKAEGARAIYADFIVCTYTPSASDDVPYLILNIKREDVSIAAELTRLNGCLEKLDSNIQVPGFLVVGNMVGEIQRKRSVDDHGEPIKELRLKDLIKINSEEFVGYLRDIASA